MKEKNTTELENVLKSTHLRDFNTYCRENCDSIISDSNTFSGYVKELLKKKGILQQRVFLNADISERYGYKLLSGEKRTKQRDIMIRIFYAAEFSLQETQRALKKYGMSELYAKNSRDALLMIMFNERPGSILDVNSILKEHGMQTLRISGMKE